MSTLDPAVTLIAPAAKTCCDADHQQIVKHCVCADAGATDLDRLDALVNDQGMDQVAASRQLWGAR